METNIKAVFFDLGNVLVRFDINILINGFSGSKRLTPEKLEKYIMRSKTGKSYMEGKISSSIFYTRTKRELKMKYKFNEFYKIWNSMFYPYPEMENITLKIKEKYPDIKLLLVSDTNQAHFDHIKEAYPFINIFDHFVLSYEVGKMKPHPYIYNEALKIAGTLSKDTIYIDDRADLIKAARSMGICAYQFTGHQKLLEDLEKHGLKI